MNESNGSMDDSSDSDTSVIVISEIEERLLSSGSKQRSINAELKEARAEKGALLERERRMEIVIDSSSSSESSSSSDSDVVVIKTPLLTSTDKSTLSVPGTPRDNLHSHDSTPRISIPRRMESSSQLDRNLDLESRTEKITLDPTSSATSSPFDKKFVFSLALNIPRRTHHSGRSGSESQGKGKGREESVEEDLRAAAWFPFAHLPGLEYMKDVLAIAGGKKVKEEAYNTLAWSINATELPWRPMLAVGGRCRVIRIYHIIPYSGAGSKGVKIVHERSITGHGGSISDLKFSSSHPHLLASASFDRTVRLWNPVLPAGSDRIALEGGRNLPDRNDRMALKKQVHRRLVRGELVGLLSDEGHSGGVLSIDIHPLLPLLLSSGTDGTIKITPFPPSIRGPSLSSLLSSPSTTPPPNEDISALTTACQIYPIFSTSTIHNGSWPDQVLWASRKNCAIISKASSNVRDPTTDLVQYGKTIRIWEANLLDKLYVNRHFSTEGSLQTWLDKRKQARERRAELDTGTSDEMRFTTAELNAHSAVVILAEIKVEGENLVGDQVGYSRAGEEGQSAEKNTLFVPEKGRIRLYKPFERKSILRQQGEVGGSEPRIISRRNLFDAQSGSYLLSLLPTQSSTTEDTTKDSELEIEEKHFACIAVGNEYTIGVGAGGLISYWSKSEIE